jgi:hypothetical protein
MELGALVFSGVSSMIVQQTVELFELVEKVHNHKQGLTRLTNEDLDSLRDSIDAFASLQFRVEELKRYLSLPKFHEDTTVQVQDVLNRLEL